MVVRDLPVAWLVHLRDDSIVEAVSLDDLHTREGVTLNSKAFDFSYALDRINLIYLVGISHFPY